MSFVDAGFGGLRARGSGVPARPGFGLHKRRRRGQPDVQFGGSEYLDEHRATGAHFLSEIVATLGLLLVIFALARSGRSRLAPAVVGSYIGAAYFFTSSTSFANPAITVGRMFSNTFAGIAPSSAPSFIAAQVVGGVVAFVVIRILYPHVTPAEKAADVVFPHHDLEESSLATVTEADQRSRLSISDGHNNERSSS